MDNEDIIEKLFITMTEIDARHNSDDGEPCFSFLTWNELCDMDCLTEQDKTMI